MGEPLSDEKLDVARAIVAEGTPLGPQIAGELLDALDAARERIERLHDAVDGPLLERLHRKVVGALPDPRDVRTLTKAALARSIVAAVRPVIAAEITARAEEVEHERDAMTAVAEHYRRRHQVVTTRPGENGWYSRFGGRVGEVTDAQRRALDRLSETREGEANDE